MTRKAALAFGIGASLMLAAGAANAAGACGTEVTALQQQLGLQQGANATVGAADPGVPQPDGGGGDAITENNANAGTNSSTTTMPSSGTVTETSRVGELNTAAGGHAEAITALKKAQLAADAGDEGTCMTELGTAKAALGVQ